MPIKPKGAKTPTEYLKMIDEPRRTEMKKLFKMIKETIPSLKPCIVADMIGFGKVAYTSKSGCSGEWFVLGLASQKNYISAYLCVADGKQYLPEKYKDVLGKVNVGKGCIRFKKMEDLDLKVFKKALKEAEKMQNNGENKMYN
jgi:uncharacterized protein YdhG (YjbR/CyaY superfamily)